MAQELVASHVTLVHELENDAELLETLKGCPAGAARGNKDARSHVLVFYDQQDAGEATSQPHLRTPPLREKGKHLERFIKLCLMRTTTPADLDDSDIYVLSDAGRPGNKMVLLNSFVDASGKVISKKSVRPVSLILSEDSLAACSEKQRGFSAINQLQTWYHVSKGPLQLNVHSRLVTPGSTNRGNVIGPVAKPPRDSPLENLILTVREKFEVFGRHGPRIPVGGPVDGDEDHEHEEPLKAKPRNKTDDEPLLFHTVPAIAHRELLHSVDAVACISLAGEGRMAFECIVRRTPYYGLCFTAMHKERLLRRLEACVFSAFQDPESKLFQQNLAKLLRESQEEQTKDGQRGTKRTAAGTPKATMPTPPTSPPAPGRQPGTSLDLLAKVREMATKAAQAEAAGGEAADGE